MKKEFITKLKTNNFLIGSFDIYEDQAKKLIKENSNLKEDETNVVLKSLPTPYRASILTKSGKYIGYIALYDVDFKNDITSVRFEVENDLNEEEKKEILEEFILYIKNSINIHNIKEFVYKSDKIEEYKKQKVEIPKNIIIPNKLLVPGVKDDVLKQFSRDYSIPNLQIAFTIMSSKKPIGIIGLSNLLWSNKRANLNLFLNKDLGNDIISELSPYLIDEYINYIHNSSIHSLSISVSGSDKDLLSVIDGTNMNYYATIPYSLEDKDEIESKFMFEHIPGMEKVNGIYIPSNKTVKKETVETIKEELSDKLVLDNGYKLIKPSKLEDENISFEKALDTHITAMQNRKKFAISLGDDKTFLQRGNEKYGLHKAFSNYSYVIFDEDNNYAGFINVLRDNNVNAEIEIGIRPSMQGDGLGTKVLTKFYEELFSIGYASVTSTVFSFNNPSLRLHDKVAEFNGVRLESYYINGKLWDMNFYTKVNENIKEKSMHK